MNKRISIEFIKEFNLFIKSLNLNKSNLGNKERKMIIRWLVNLNLIDSKISVNNAIKRLYFIKEKLIKKFEKQSLKTTNKNKTIKPKIESNLVYIENSKKKLIFKNLKLTEKNHSIFLHIPKIESSKWKLKKTKTQFKKVGKKQVSVKENYKKWDLLWFILEKKINWYFKELNNFNLFHNQK